MLPLCYSWREATLHTDYLRKRVIFVHMLRICPCLKHKRITIARSFYKSFHRQYTNRNTHINLKVTSLSNCIMRITDATVHFERHIRSLCCAAFVWPVHLPRDICSWDLITTTAFFSKGAFERLKSQGNAVTLLWVHNQQLHLKRNISNASVSYALDTDNVALLWISLVCCDKNFFEHQLYFSKWKMSLNYFRWSRWESATPWISFTGGIRPYLLPSSCTVENCSILWWMLFCFTHGCCLILLLSTLVLICKTVTHN